MFNENNVTTLRNMGQRFLLIAVKPEEEDELENPEYSTVMTLAGAKRVVSRSQNQPFYINGRRFSIT